MTSAIVTFAAALILGVVLGVLKSRKDRRIADRKIQESFDQSLRRTNAGLQATPITEIYPE